MPSKRSRVDDEPTFRAPTARRKSFWYIRGNQPPTALCLDTLVTGQRLVSYDNKAMHGNWELTESPDGNTYSINFNANPDKPPRAHTFNQIDNTNTYRHIGNRAEWTVLIMFVPSSSW